MAGSRLSTASPELARSFFLPSSRSRYARASLTQRGAFQLRVAVSIHVIFPADRLQRSRESTSSTISPLPFAIAVPFLSLRRARVHIAALPPLPLLAVASRNRTQAQRTRGARDTPLGFISRRSRGCTVAPFRGTRDPASRSNALARSTVSPPPSPLPRPSHVPPNTAKYADVYAAR